MYLSLEIFAHILRGRIRTGVSDRQMPPLRNVLAPFFPVLCQLCFCAIDATNRKAHTHTNTQHCCVAHAAVPRGSTFKHAKILETSGSALPLLLRSCGSAPSGEGTRYGHLKMHCFQYVFASSQVRSGVKRLRVIDFDQVSLSSLNRHAVATWADVGLPKVKSLGFAYSFLLTADYIERFEDLDCGAFGTVRTFAFDNTRRVL